MIKTGIKTYDHIREPMSPLLRRSSRDSKREYNYEQIEKIKIYYGTRTSHIKNVVDITKKYKRLKQISHMINKLFISKYGKNFGTIFSNEIMKDYLAVSDNTTNWYSVWYPPSPQKRHVNQSPLWYSREAIKIANIMGITDPRINTYHSMDVMPYIKKGYSIISNGTGWNLLSKSNSPYHWRESEESEVDYCYSEDEDENRIIFDRILNERA